MMIVKLSRTSARRNLNKQLLLSNTYSISHDYQRFLFTVVQGAHSWLRRTKPLHLVDSLLIHLDWFPSIICIGLFSYCYYTFIFIFLSCGFADEQTIACNSKSGVVNDDGFRCASSFMVNRGQCLTHSVARKLIICNNFRWKYINVFNFHIAIDRIRSAFLHKLIYVAVKCVWRLNCFINLMKWKRSLVVRITFSPPESACGRATLRELCRTTV